MRDRMFEIKSEKSEPEALTKVDDFFSKVTEIKASLNELKVEIKEIKETQNECLLSVSDNKNKQNQQKLQSLTDQITIRSTNLKNSLKQLESTDKVKQTQHSALVTKFVNEMQDYKQIQQDYKQKKEKKLQRQLLIVNPKMTREEIEQEISKGDQIFSMTKKTAAKQVYEEIESQHLEILQIEKSLLELQQLFIDMATLIDSQGEVLNSIEEHVKSSVAYTGQGVDELKKAIVHQRNSRRVICF